MDELSSDNFAEPAKAPNERPADAMRPARSPLAYESRRDRASRDLPGQVAGKIVALIFGGCIGIAIMFVLGGVVFGAIGLEAPSDRATNVRAKIAAALFVGFTLCTCRFWRVAWRSSFSRWFLSGLLIGMGLISLIEGACFGFRS